MLRWPRWLHRPMKVQPLPKESESFFVRILPTALSAILCWLLPLALYVVTRHRPAPTTKHPARTTPYGVILGSCMLFLSVSSAAVTFPFMQARLDALGCDALCQGGQTSLRSGLTLVGAMLVGRLSDRYGRIPMLWLGAIASLAGLTINGGLNSLQGMWLAIFPVALLNHNFAVTKALFSDYIDESGGGEVEKAGAVGKLGMAVGFSFMLGPLVSSIFVSDYLQALRLSAGISCLSTGANQTLPLYPFSGFEEL